MSHPITQRQSVTVEQDPKIPALKTSVLKNKPIQFPTGKCATHPGLGAASARGPHTMGRAPLWTM